MIAIKALDALGLALTSHDHQWTKRERELYERAISFLTSLSRRDAGSSALEKCSLPKPSHK